MHIKFKTVQKVSSKPADIEKRYKLYRDIAGTICRLKACNTIKARKMEKAADGDVAFAALFFSEIYKKETSVM